MALEEKNQAQGLLAVVLAALLLSPAPPISHTPNLDRSAHATGEEFPVSPPHSTPSPSIPELTVIEEPFDTVLGALQIPSDGPVHQSGSFSRPIPASFKKRN